MQNGRPLVPYLRQSRAKERTISIEEQRRDIRAWAVQAGVELAPEIVEQNVSGSKPWRERGLGDAVEACARGEASGIIVAWQDRLSRENGRATAEVWEALDAIGARLVCAAEGLDTATGDHEMLFTIKAAIAREQWKRHRANWERAQRSATERGVPSGRAPIGYRKVKRQPLRIHKAEARKVLEAFEARARGVAISEIARRHGWAHSTCRQILANPVYLGTLTRGGIVTENAHPAIVGRDLFDAVQASRTVQPVPPGDTTRDRLLPGIARCAGCRKTLKVVRRARTDGTHAVAYYCKNAATAPCPAQAFARADDLDAFIAEWFTAAIRTVPRPVDVVAAGRELEAAQAELAKAEAELAAYVENASALDAQLFRKGLDARQGRVEAARSAVQANSHHLSRLPTGGPLWKLWDGFGIAERRTVLAAALDRVEVSRGATNDLPGHVRVYWQDGTAAEVVIPEKAERVRVAVA